MTDTTETTEQIPEQSREDVTTLALKYIDKAQKQNQHCYNYYVAHKDTEEYKQRARAAKKTHNDDHKEEIKAKRAAKYKEDEEYRNKVREGENTRYTQRRQYNALEQRGRPQKTKPDLQQEEGSSTDWF